MKREKRKDQNKQFKNNKPLKKERLYGYLKYFLYLIIIAVIIGSFIWLYVFTGKPSTCAYCHEIKPDVYSYQKSLHAEVKCYDCHASDYPLAGLTARFGLLGDIYNHFRKDFNVPLNSDGDLGKLIKDRKCENCHSVKRGITPRRGILINHEIHKKNNISCVSCHNRVAHPIPITVQVLVKEQISTEVPYRDYMEMEGCMRCHTGKKGEPTDKCDVCHPEQFKLPYNCSACHEEALEQIKPRNHLIANYKGKEHAADAKNNYNYCYQCHTKESCDDCHEENNLKIKLPEAKKISFHEPESHFKTNFLPPLHGDEAKDRGKEYCYQCHNKKYCNDCHNNLVMPHPADFTKEHGKIVSKVSFEASCQSCHHSRNVFCESGCHHKGWNPKLGPLDKTHPQVVALNSVQYCLTCHTSVFCAVCHVSGEKKQMFR